MVASSARTAGWEATQLVGPQVVTPFLVYVPPYVGFLNATNLLANNSSAPGVQSLSSTNPNVTITPNYGIGPVNLNISAPPRLNGISYAREFGALPGGVALNDVSITNGTGQFYSASGSFAQTDVGHGVIIYTNLATVLSYHSLAGNWVSNVVYPPLLTTIASVQDGQHATLSDVSLATLVPTKMWYGPDETATVQAAIDRIVLTNWGGEVVLDAGVHYFNGPLRFPSAQNSVLVIPAFNTNQISLTIRGSGGNSFGYYTGYNPTYASTNGTVLICGTKGSGTQPAFIGGNMGAAQNGSPWSSVALHLVDLQLMIPANASIGLINCGYGGGLMAERCTFISDWWGDLTHRANTMAPTSTNAFGVICPGIANNGANTFRNCWFMGFDQGVVTGDHTTLNDVMINACNAAIVNETTFLGGTLSGCNVALQANRYGVLGLNNGYGGYAKLLDLWVENNSCDFSNVISGVIFYHSNHKLIVQPAQMANRLLTFWDDDGSLRSHLDFNDFHLDDTGLTANAPGVSNMPFANLNFAAALSTGPSSPWNTTAPDATTSVAATFVVGCQFTPTADLTVTSLGRWSYSTSEGGASVGLWKTNDTLLGFVNVPSAGGTANAYNYATLPKPISLVSGTSYKLAECVTNVTWHADAVYTVTADATLDSSWYVTSSTLIMPTTQNGGAGDMFGPVSFQYYKTKDVTLPLNSVAAAPNSNSFWISFGNGAAVTNHMVRVVNGSLSDYWCDGTNVYSKTLAP